VKAAAFVPQETIPKNTDNRIGIRNIILFNRDQAESIFVFTSSFLRYSQADY
jgi:hypothetical protein